MAKLIARTTVLPTASAQFPIQFSALSITELPLSGIIRIQGNAQDPLVTTAIENATGLSLPQEDQLTAQHERRLAQVAPNEWLLFTSLEEEQTQFAALENAFSGIFATATLISDSRVIFRITGEATADLLAKGSSLDFHPSAFPAERMRNTRFAGIAAAIAHLQQGEYRLYVDLSYADYVLHWLIDASAEFRQIAIH